MNEIANQLAQSLFKKNSLQECSRWELEILADKYPYFGIAQLMLAGKLRQENNDEAYKKQVRKTSLYFSNPLWLDYTLHNKTTQPAGISRDDKPRQAAAIRIEELPVVVPPVAEEITTVPDEAEIPSPVVNEPVTDQSEVESAATGPGNDMADEEANEPAEAIKIAPLKIEPAPDENTPLEFQAFHTVDYFASQGIKLKTEEVPKDRFDRQLKSFTEWLKTLRKTPVSEIAKDVDKGSEQKVITLAEHSLENRDIVTETMAEVWIKQGNREKAIEVYDKLSLQNPAKSSYFASLIEQLKNS